MSLNRRGEDLHRKAIYARACTRKQQRPSSSISGLAVAAARRRPQRPIFCCHLKKGANDGVFFGAMGDEPQR